MKRLYLIILVTFLFGGSTNAQTYNMKVEKTNGETITIPVSLIKRVSYVTDEEGDDEGGDDGGSSSDSLIKQIIGVTESDDNCTFEYDAKGRVIKANSRTYSYGEKAIFVNGRQEYVLSNGRIIKEDDYETFSYDSNGYLSKQSGDVNYTFTWKDGNLTNYGDDTNYFTITYSKLKWPKGWMHYWKYTEMDAYLQPAGAWGKLPINLPAVISQYDEEGLWRTFSYEYSQESGRITQLIVTISEPNEGYSKSYVYQFIY